jgi:hypothetical protein
MHFAEGVKNVSAATDGRVELISTSTVRRSSPVFLHERDLAIDKRLGDKRDHRASHKELITSGSGALRVVEDV